MKRPMVFALSHHWPWSSSLHSHLTTYLQSLWFHCACSGHPSSLLIEGFFQLDKILSGSARAFVGNHLPIHIEDLEYGIVNGLSQWWHLPLWCGGCATTQ